jgi:hypothetical protein
MWPLPRRLDLAGVFDFLTVLFFTLGLIPSVRPVPVAAFASEPIRARLPSVVMYTLGIVSDK